MITENLITKVTQIFPREDGSEARIVAENFGDQWNPQIGIYVHTRKNPDSEWELCSDRPHKDWRTMSVDDYVKNGRPESLVAVSFGERVRVTKLIGQPMSVLH
jgi:hypothetical protein